MKVHIDYAYLTPVNLRLAVAKSGAARLLTAVTIIEKLAALGLQLSERQARVI